MSLKINKFDFNSIPAEERDILRQLNNIFKKEINSIKEEKMNFSVTIKKIY